MMGRDKRRTFDVYGIGDCVACGRVIDELLLIGDVIPRDLEDLERLEKDVGRDMMVNVFVQLSSQNSQPPVVSENGKVLTQAELEEILNGEECPV
jgi:hypothetical protein